MSDVALRCTLAGSTQEIFVSSGSLQLRQRGPWLAREIVCSSKAAPAEGSPATLLCRREDGGSDDFVGTVRRAAVNTGDETLTLALVAGKGGLLQQLPPLDHVLGGAYVPAGVIARAICDAAGETLAPGVEEALDLVTLPRWHRATDTTAAVALDLLAWQLSGAGAPSPGQPPYFWRVLPSGEAWIGAETWPTISGAAYWTGLDPDDGVTTYAVRGAPFAVGQSIDGIRAIEVFYQLGDAGLDVRVRAAVAGDPSHVPDLDLYRGSYSGTVVAQNADGTIDVRCDDARVGSLQRLAFRVGIPGCSVTFDPTTDPPPRVRVRFDGASPAGAFAEGADQDAGAQIPVAIARGYLYAQIVTGAVVALYWSPNQGAPAGSPSWAPVSSGPSPPDNFTQGTLIAVPSGIVSLRR